MTQQTNTSEPTTVELSRDFTDFILRRLRVTQLRAQLISNEVETIAVALGGGLIDSETAWAMLGEAGLDITATSS